MKRTGEIALGIGVLCSTPIIWGAGGYDATHKGANAIQTFEALTYGASQNTAFFAVAAVCFALTTFDAVTSRRGHQ